MTEQAVARRVPWATVIGWAALLLAVAAAVGAVLAVVYAVEGFRNPQGFGDLGAVVVLMVSLVPALPALVAGIVQARRGWAPRWRWLSTVVLAALAPAATVVLLLRQLVS
ncbi:hypothetical protein [Cellulomonas sp. Leaf334]|uniref:hypothetical protein n=1 Tax=Cellulomonas sp. Leaf334 TaxID=1736339 RepID=UPI0006F2E8D6|nr:hypothetical protein [Cellulomonas sp. Leaf334]KQR17399.1 hypothetical protein ASF78_08950 [Cellulomonas sp. Leaf334]